MNLDEKRKLLLKKNLCNHCLGRQFAQLGYGLENYERGAIVRNQIHINKDSFTRDNIPEGVSPGGSCYICQGVFNKLSYYEDLILKSLSGYEADTILVGTRPTREMKRKEKTLHHKYGNQYAKTIKYELNRLLGKNVKKALKVGVDFENPDITVVVDLESDNIELQLSPLLILGQYNKYSRNISQTKWNYSRNSIEEIIQEPFIKAAQAKEAKFHGAGREDKNVRCFGKRKFVFELVYPKKRKLNLKKLSERVNKSKKIEIFNLKFTNKNRIKEIKAQRHNKIYRALVTLSRDIKEKELDELEQIVGSIKQKTPQRVRRHRTNINRNREVFYLAAEKIAPEIIEIIVKAEAGTYIKELISGDKGRTVPSVAQIMGIKAECTQLDVVDIDY